MAARALTLDELVAAHTTTTALVHTVEAKIHIHPYAPHDSPLGEPMRTWDWRRSGEVERIVSQNQMLRREHGQLQFQDFWRDGRERRVLRNWNPTENAKLLPWEQHRVDAFIEPDSRDEPDSVFPEMPLLLTFWCFPPDAPRTLKEMIREFGPSTLRGKQDADGHVCQLLRIDLGKHSGLLPGSYVDLYLDEAVGYLCRKSVFHAVPRSNTLSGPPYEREQRVEEFFSGGNGVFFPTAIRGYSADRTESSRVIASDVRINQPLRPGALDFRFLDNMIVARLPGKNGKASAELWVNNERERELTEADFAEFRRKSAESITLLVDAQPWWARGAWYGTVVFVLFVVMAVVWRVRARWA